MVKKSWSWDHGKVPSQDFFVFIHKTRGSKWSNRAYKRVSRESLCQWFSKVFLSYYFDPSLSLSSLFVGRNTHCGSCGQFDSVAGAVQPAPCVAACSRVCVYVERCLCCGLCMLWGLHEIWSFVHVGEWFAFRVPIFETCVLYSLKIVFCGIENHFCFVSVHFVHFFPSFFPLFFSAVCCE